MIALTVGDSSGARERPDVSAFAAAAAAAARTHARPSPTLLESVGRTHSFPNLLSLRLTPERAGSREGENFPVPDRRYTYY